jgi:DNA-binding protein YbaB
MTGPMEAELQSMLELFHEQHAAMLDTQRRLREITATAVAPKRTVTVVAGCQGEVTELSFPTQAYRSMAPAELAAVIKGTIAKARAEVMRQVSDLMGPVLPEGMSFAELTSAGMDPGAWVPGQLPKTIDELFGGSLGGPSSDRAKR